jgi:hypothetical protein
MNRLVIGGLAGLSATAAMTMVMRHLHKGLPEPLQYPLPPREIVEEIAPVSREEVLRTLTLLSHFGYGAAAGALYAITTTNRSNFAGMTFGAAVWFGSYLGWIPASRILTPATAHPMARNVLMICSHLVWGATTGLVARELKAAERRSFNETKHRSLDVVRRRRLRSTGSRGSTARKSASRGRRPSS